MKSVENDLQREQQKIKRLLQRSDGLFLLLVMYLAGSEYHEVVHKKAKATNGSVC